LIIITNAIEEMTTLLELWKDRRDFFVEKKFSQIISITGERELNERNNNSLQIREFLNEVPTRVPVLSIMRLTCHKIQRALLIQRHKFFSTPLTVFPKKKKLVFQYHLVIN
jgi:hypothetical protein